MPLTCLKRRGPPGRRDTEAGAALELARHRGWREIWVEALLTEPEVWARSGGWPVRGLACMLACSSKRTGRVSSEACGDPSNVVLFPIWLRAVRDDDAASVDAAAAMALIGEIEPSFREVVLAGDAGGYALPPSGLSEPVREETARYVMEQVLPLTPGERRRALCHLLGPVLGAALAACRASAGAARRSRASATEVERAHREGGYWMEPRQRQAEALAREAGRLLIVAYVRCQEARGVERAVGLARRGEAWTAPEGGNTAAWHDVAGVTA